MPRVSAVVSGRKLPQNVDLDRLHESLALIESASGLAAANREDVRTLPGLEGLYRSPPAAVVVGRKGQLYRGRSFCCLVPSSCLRRCAIRVVEAPFFDPFVLATIVLNCATMAWQSPLDPEGTPKAALLEVCCAPAVDENASCDTLSSSAPSPRLAAHRARAPPTVPASPAARRNA